MPTLACVYFARPDAVRRDTLGIYSPEWVRKMRDAVARHNPAWRFVCLSDVDVPCERIPLQHNWPGSWAKIELFRPGLFDGPVVYLDLDTIILRDLTPMVRTEFAMQRDPIPENGPGCSAAMAWHGDGAASIYHTFAADPQHWIARYPRGRPAGRRCLRDQGFAQDTLPLTGEWLPVASYKHDCKDGPPDWAVAVTFHGRPKQSQVDDQWVKDAWR